MDGLEAFVKEIKKGSAEMHSHRSNLATLLGNTFRVSCVCTGVYIDSCMALGPFNDSCLAIGKK